MKTTPNQICIRYAAFTVAASSIEIMRYTNIGASQGGSSGEWENYIQGRVSGQGDQYKLILNIMDKDTFSANDFIGQATGDIITSCLLVTFYVLN